MPSKVQGFAQLAEQAASQLTGSRERWTAFLTTAARLYKYPYDEQLLIFAQRPEATACAEYGFWNEKMHRYVRRGSEGIALIDDSGDKPRLRYVFDVADTGGGENSRRPFLWELKPEHEDAVSAMLEREYDVSSDKGIADQLERIAAQMADEYWQDNQRDILYIIDDSYLEDYDEFNIGVQFRSAATVSITYALMSRCGLEPDEAFEHEDFLSIFDFNTNATVSALGTAVSELSQQVLRQIEITVKKYERERSVQNDRIDLQPERRLPDTRPDNHGADPENRQIREDAQDVPEGASPDTVQQHAAFGEAVSAPAGDRADGSGTSGSDDAGADEIGGRNGEPESIRPDALGGPHEQLESAGRGNVTDGAYLQLSLFPTEKEQIQRTAESKQPFAFSLPQQDIDHILRTGSNEDNSVLRICAMYRMDKSAEENAALLRQEYRGGKGLYLDGEKMSVWFDEDGIHIAKGDTAMYADVKQLISWKQAEQRIGELLSQGQYISRDALASVDTYERTQLAERLWYVYHDLSDEARNAYFDAEIFRGGFPDSTARLAALLAEPDSRGAITAELERFVAAYAQEHDLLRFHYHRPQTLLDNLRDLQLPRREYTSELTDVPHLRMFITQDEADAALTNGSGFEGGKFRIYVYFTQSHNTLEKADFLKNEFGTGGRSHALSGASDSWEEYSAKGIEYRRGRDDDSLRLTWNAVAKRIDFLITKYRYLSTEEKARFEERQWEQAGLTDTPAPEPTPPFSRIEEVAPQAESEQPSAFSMPVAIQCDVTQDDIDAALQEWNGSIESKRAVVRHMREHARNKETAAFLRAEFGDDLPTFPVTVEGAATDVPWPKVQRRIAQLIAADKFYTEAEYDNLDDVDPVAIRERLAESGIVNGEVVDEEALDNDPFIRQVLADAERVARHDEFVSDLPYKAGDTVYLEDGKPFIIDEIGTFDIRLSDPSLTYPIFRSESRESFSRILARFPQPDKEQSRPTNFRITDDHLGEGGAKAKYGYNVGAIRVLKTIEAEVRFATPEEQEILSHYVGWGGIPQAFDSENASWVNEYVELKALLTGDEYDMARASTLNAHYTSPTVIKAIYETVQRMGFTTGNILEPACGVGNFFGLIPDELSGSRLYGVELDSITGRIAAQLYPDANITVSGFEKTALPDSFFDLAVGNVPFGSYKVPDKKYDKHNFLIHDYFLAKSLDQVRPGGTVAFVTSKGTMDKKSAEVRRYLAQRAELLGAVRLPNNAFLKNAGTEVTSDILFLQKRDRPIDVEPDWVHIGQTVDGVPINSYFVHHPEMVLGSMAWDDRMYGNQKETTCVPIEGADLAEQLREALSRIEGQITEMELPDLGENEEIDTSIPADPIVRNFSYTLVDGEVYYRENSRMVRPELNQTAKERVNGLIGLRNCVHALMDYQLNDYTDWDIAQKQAELNTLYEAFTAKYGLINSRGNSLAFASDSAYYLLCSLEVLDEDGNLERKADMFSKRTIKRQRVVTAVDTASEALALSVAEKARVDMDYMAGLTGMGEEQLAVDLQGVIFRLPEPPDRNGKPRYVPADEYLSGNVRNKLREARRAVEVSDIFRPNVTALEAAQPKDLSASEIDVRLGATWIAPEYIQQFMVEIFQTPGYLQDTIEVRYVPYTAEWSISNKNTVSYNNVAAYVTYGTDRANAYRILEETLNLRDIRIYDTVTDPDGKERSILNSKDTTLAQQKQQAIKDAFRDWIWHDPDRRRILVSEYNEKFNSIRPREYDGRHITFAGMNPEITLQTHQINAAARQIYGGNTLLAHEVGSGKTFEMIAGAMESKRLGLCQKSLFAVPNHLTEQWAAEFLRLYPQANILVTTKKDFEKQNRKKFCARIATGDYDAVIIGHSQFERIPISVERQERLLQEQIWEITEGISEVKGSGGERFTIKQLERTKKSLEAKLEKLLDSSRKDDVVTFEQLGVDRLFVDEAHSYKNLFLFTKMRNVAGLSTSDAQKSSDMFLKCRYIDELTEGRGVIFATGTPVSNSMTELYTMQRYLQYLALQRQGLSHFDCWASTFGETVTAIELAPEGTGYRARTRFAKFFNLPELMNLFKEVADIKTADQLNLPVPKANFHTVVVQPTEHQKDMVSELSERAAAVHTGTVDPRDDNMLKITSDGRKLGLDQRIVNPLLPDDPGSKVNRCVDNICRIWEDGQPGKLTQLVFCDISTPKSRTSRLAAKAADKTINGVELRALDDALEPDVKMEDAQFTVYDDIRDKLISRGIPTEQIAFIHDANTEVRKKELFAKVRSGQVRVLMGSTFKMGAGMNVQDRLRALHDLDCPWRPGDLEQRGGRIIRQGNMNPEVDIYRYVTDGTFDAYLWQTVENKQRFISQIMTSKSPVRSCEDVDETALSYAEIKALCAGNPLIKEKMDLDIDVARLKLLKAEHQSQQYRLEDDLLRYFPESIEKNKGYIKGFEIDMSTLAEHPHPENGFAGMLVRGDTLTDKDNAGAAILEACKEGKSGEPMEIGQYRGFAMYLCFDSFDKEYSITLKGAMSHKAILGKDVRGNLTRIDNALSQMPERLRSVQGQLDNLYQQMEAAKQEIGKSFPHETELAKRSSRLAVLDAELNMDGGRPPVQDQTAKQERLSVLDGLSAPCQSNGKKHKYELEAR